MTRNDKTWYVLYTDPNREKKVFALLTQRGIEAYCPLNRVRKRWSDRLKWVEEPLFKSYVFVRVAENEAPTVRMTPGVINFVYWLGKPAVVKDKEIETIRKFLNDYYEVEALPLDLSIDAKVTIRKGVFMDKEAKITKILKNKVQVVIESIGYSLVALLDKSNISLANK
jgi:transcription antitermination factor NusG